MSSMSNKIINGLDGLRTILKAAGYHDKFNVIQQAIDEIEKLQNKIAENYKEIDHFEVKNGLWEKDMNKIRAETNQKDAEIADLKRINESLENEFCAKLLAVQNGKVGVEWKELKVEIDRLTGILERHGFDVKTGKPPLGPWPPNFILKEENERLMKLLESRDDMPHSKKEAEN